MIWKHKILFIIIVAIVCTILWWLGGLIWNTIKTPQPQYCETIQDILDSTMKNHTIPDSDIFDSECIVLIIGNDRKTQVNMEKCGIYMNRIAINPAYRKVEVVLPEKIVISNGRVKQFCVIEEID